MRSLAALLARRFERLVTLTAEERDVLDTLAAPTTQRFGPRETFARIGDPYNRIFAMLDGFACRFRTLPDGGRQIISLMLPGDLCDTRSFALPHFDHSICSLSSIEVVSLTAEAVRRLEVYPGLRRTFDLSSLISHSIAREWL